jgi:hypothetical protein
MKLLSLAAACLLALPAPAYARDRPAPTPPPADVWVNPVADLGVTAGLAADYLNQFTGTKFACMAAPDDDKACLPAPCPSARMCLTVRFGQFADDSVDARFVAVYCAGGCLKAGLIEVNPEGPLYAQYGYWNPFHHLLLMERMAGVFTGLPTQPACVSSMSHYSCTMQGFTAAEAAHLAGW